MMIMAILCLYFRIIIGMRFVVVVEVHCDDANRKWYRKCFRPKHNVLFNVISAVSDGPLHVVTQLIVLVIKCGKVEEQ